jgi:hypothetical protein
MIKALIAGVIGAIFMGVTSFVPGVNLFNMCCGAWFIIGGVLAAWVWTKLNDGQASFFYGLLSGVLSGMIYSACTIGVATLMMAGQADMVGKQLATSQPVQALPDRPLSADEMVMLARKFVEENTENEAKRAEQLAKLDKLAADIAAAKEDPAKAADLQKGVDMVNQGIAAIKAGDLSLLIGWVVMLMACIAVCLITLSTIGGFFGGLMFGSDAPQASPGQPSATADTIPAG